MDSIPQELIDAIIDNVIQSSLPSCSLVTSRWQRKSQQRVFGTITFSSEGKVKRWCTDVPQDLDGISSYVRHVKVVDIRSWTEPALLGRMLGSLSSLTALSMYKIKIPNEFPGHISRGEFGEGITTLDLRSLFCGLPTLTSMILSLPNLKELRVGGRETIAKAPLPTHSVAPKRGPLDLLKLYGPSHRMGEALAEFRLTSRHLSLDVVIKNVGRLLSLSSEMVVELTLRDTSNNWIPPPIHLPPLPALTTLVIDLRVFNPSPRLTNILCSIDSAPALTSIIVEPPNRIIAGRLPSASSWVDVDRWLSRIAKHTKVVGGLSLTLRRWPEGKSVWKGFLPEFRESGGKIKAEIACGDADNRELRNPPFKKSWKFSTLFSSGI